MQRLENKYCGQRMVIKPVLSIKHIVWKKQKQISQNWSIVDENIKQDNNCLVEELKIKIKLLEYENTFVREDRDNNNKFFHTILDYKTSLLKHNETLHYNPYSTRSSNGSIDKTSKDIFNNKLPADISKKIKVKEEIKKLIKP